MSQRLIKPGLLAASRIIGYHKGQPVWLAMGGAPEDDDPNDPKFTGQDDDDADDDESDEDESEEDDEDEDAKKKKKVKSKKDDDDDDEEDDPKVARASRQAAKYRTQLRESQKQNAELEARLRAIENKDRKPEEIASEELTTERVKAEKLAARNRELTLQNAFLASNVVDWVDPEDALRLVDLEDVEIDDDGTVDRKALRAALRDLARRKPHLVKSKAKPSGKADEDDDEDDDADQGSRRSAAPMNGKRKGSRETTDRAALAKKFPALQRR
jgi:hypothetical protein